MRKISKSGVFTFRNADYEVATTADDSAITVQLVETSSCQLWANTFSAKAVEDITRKTGNFKQFTVFTHMLLSAVERSSDAVSLDLLTYSDLQQLREKKVGRRSPLPKSTTDAAHQRRYLILTYSVEFDRIHFPLPLSYSGTSSVYQSAAADAAAQQLEHLKDECKELSREKKQLASEVEAMRQEIRTSTDRGGSTNARERQLLREMVTALERELIEEKSHLQKQISKRNDTISQLRRQIEEFRASERQLKVKLAAAQRELAEYKRRGLSGRASANSLTSRSPSLRGTGVNRISRSPSAEPSGRSSWKLPAISRLSPSPSQSRRTDRSSFGKDRETYRRSLSWSNDRERFKPASLRRAAVSPPVNGNAFASAGRSRLQNISLPSSYLRRPLKRFNPTAWAQERNRKLEEARLSAERRRRALANGGGLRRVRSPAGSSDQPSFERQLRSYPRSRSPSPAVKRLASPNGERFGRRESNDRRLLSSFEESPTMAAAQMNSTPRDFRMNGAGSSGLMRPALSPSSHEHLHFSGANSKEDDQSAPIRSRKHRTSSTKGLYLSDQISEISNIEQRLAQIHNCLKSIS